MTATEYLATLPAVVVNLDKSTDRWAHMNARVRPYVQSMIRSPGVPKDLLTADEVLEFKEKGLATMAAHPELQINSQDSMNFWRGSLAILKAFTQAIETGAMLYDRFIVMEDDAMINPISIGKAEKPPPDSAVNIWGGALVGGSYAAHFRRAVEIEKNTWYRIPQTPEGVARRVSATAVEMDSAIVERWLEIVWAHPMAYDNAWWFAMMEIPTFVPDAEIIPQELELPSIRMPASSALRAKHGRRWREQGLIQD